MKILIDGDSCSRTNAAIKTAKKYKIPVHVYCDINHTIEHKGAEIHTVDQGADSTDFAIITHTEPYDIVITSDSGLASLALSKNAGCISPTGTIYTTENIDRYIQNRYFTQRQAHKSRRPKYPKKKKRTHQNNRPLFIESFGYLIRQQKRLLKQNNNQKEG